MEFGVALPTSGPLASPGNIGRFAQQVEQLGYSSVWTYERLLRPLDEVVMRRGGRRRMPEDFASCFEPLETLSYVAALTNRIILGTSVINALFHPPVVLARRFATLDQLSGGRVIAGVGQGWVPQEFDTANVPFRRRGAGMDEMITAVRACWASDPVAFQGRFYTIAPSQINPKPAQKRLPIVMGATTSAGVRRAGRIADGLNLIADTLEVAGQHADMFRTAAADAGRDPSALMVIARANVPITEHPIGERRPFLGGSPQQINDDLARLAGIGVDHVLFDNTQPSHDIDDELRLLDQLKTTCSAVEYA